MEGTVGDIDLTVAARGYREANVVAGASDQCALRIDGAPILSGVIGSPHRALVFGLNERVDAPRIARGNGDVDLAHRRMRQTVFLDPRPLHAAIVRDINPAAGAAA